MRSLEALDRMLDQEHDALLAGNLQGVLELSAQKEKLLRRLAGDSAGMNAAGVAVVKDKAARNAALLGAARRGVAAARDRLQQIKTGGTVLNTYNKHGERAALGGAIRRVEHRA